LVTQLCHPPVGDIAMLATAGLDRESTRTSTFPVTPAAAPDARRAVKLVPPAPKSRLSYCSQSPPAIQPTS
jgi:hypothetical protein